MPRSKYSKFNTLKYIFMEKTLGGTKRIGTDIDFTLSEVGQAIEATGGTKPASISNFVLDLTRKDKGITKRLPNDVIKYGYDLRKKTGPVGTDGDNYCGTFVYRGKDEEGNTIPLKDWFEWGVPDRTIEVDSSSIPPLVRSFLSNDEASLFSVIDYCDLLSKIFDNEVFRVQSPMKWQPNEIDGFYVASTARNTIIYPVEAKARSTKDDINIVQIYGQYKTLIDKYQRDGFTLIVRPVAARMEADGIHFAILEINPFYHPTTNRDSQMFNVSEVVKVKLNPPLVAWE